jgi:hypothetical protein
MSTATAAQVPEAKPQGMRKNGTEPEEPRPHPALQHRLTRQIGKQWHEPKSAFRPKAGNSSYAKRLEERKAMGAVKAKEKEMKEEKEAERQVSYSLNLPEEFQCYKWFLFLFLFTTEGRTDRWAEEDNRD